MRFTKLLLACLVVAAMVAGAAFAQEGYPLKGSWIGDWGPNRTTRNQVFVVIDWDGKAISGTINPGSDNIPLKNATLTPPPPPPPGAGGGGRGGGNNRGGGAGGQAGAGGNAGAGAAAGGGGGQGGGRRGGGGQGGGGAAPAAGATAPAAAAPAAAAPAAPAPPPVPVSKDWFVHFEGDGKDKSGAAVHYVVDGKIINVGVANRFVEGTWMSGATKNDFKIVRQ